MGTLYCGDSFKVLRRHLKDGPVDLFYLEPPRNSAQSHNAFFHRKDKIEAANQIHALRDTWSWNRKSFLGRNDMMAYLKMMPPRLVELHRVLKPTGSLYLRGDPAVSHSATAA